VTFAFGGQKRQPTLLSTGHALRHIAASNKFRISADRGSWHILTVAPTPLIDRGDVDAFLACSLPPGATRHDQRMTCAEKQQASNETSNKTSNMKKGCSIYFIAFAARIGLKSLKRSASPAPGFQ
jgi:hypothetical protein